ncbi:unnamed protein product [Alopecurus aequalis]
MLSSCSGGGGGGHPSSPQKHGRCDEQEGQDGFLGIAGASPPPPPSCSFLGSTGFPGAQMLSFSSDAAGLGLSSGASMQGFLARVRGPFTPTQWMELEHQALIYKHIAANAPVPSSLLLPIRRSIHPWGWAPFRSGGADVEPGRCRRTDGKKWRCSRDSVGDQKYCERHINRGRQRSRKHVEGRKVTPTIAEPTMVVSGGVSSHSQAVAWQQQVKTLAANVTDPFPRHSNRELLEKQNTVEQSLVSTPLDSFDFTSPHSSSNCDEVAFLPLKSHHDLDQAYITHGACSSSEKGTKAQETWSPLTKETLDDGPLGEVFRSKSSQSAYGTS